MVLRVTGETWRVLRSTPHSAVLFSDRDAAHLHQHPRNALADARRCSAASAAVMARWRFWLEWKYKVAS
jgi:hypothetical protein